MNSIRTAVAVAAALVSTAGSSSRRAGAAPAATELEQLTEAFAARTGTRLVFAAAELPAGGWYDRMPELASTRRVAAAKILLAEAAKYPPGWLGALGLHQVGVFDALVSNTGDGFRPHDRAQQGYLFYGMWNGKDAVVAAYYGDGQLPLTFHHEVYHHIDAAEGCAIGRAAFTGDDARFAGAVAGTHRYPALALTTADREALAAQAGDPLVDAVSAYAVKSPGEDQAETARWLMANLTTGLWQAAMRPELAGSQRILHVLAQYQAAGTVAAPGPDPAWLVAIALGRGPGRGPGATRFAAAVEAAYQALSARIAPDGEPRFVVWYQQDADGGNRALRADLARFGAAAEQLAAHAGASAATPIARANAGARLRGLLARYHRYIAGQWSISAATERGFAAARARIDLALPARRTAPAAATAPVAPPTNRYLGKVDAEIADPAWRAAIRAVQPATVKLGGGSGVNLAPAGLVLTAAHVVDTVGARVIVRFPDGSSYQGVCTFLDADLDLALVALAGAAELPWARMAAAAPKPGADVAIVGQPGTRTPDGAATGYQPWHVSTGTIRGFRAGARTGGQHLGRAKHDAWTYWGHSGSALFDRTGAIVALHNSWDATTAMRHAVTWEAIVEFLRTHR